MGLAMAISQGGGEVRSFKVTMFFFSARKKARVSDNGWKIPKLHKWLRVCPSDHISE